MQFQHALYYVVRVMIQLSQHVLSVSCPIPMFSWSTNHAVCTCRLHACRTPKPDMFKLLISLEGQVAKNDN
jgi:hypothetical protein